MKKTNNKKKNINNKKNTNSMVQKNKKNTKKFKSNKTKLSSKSAISSTLIEERENLKIADKNTQSIINKKKIKKKSSPKAIKNNEVTKILPVIELKPEVKKENKKLKVNQAYLQILVFCVFLLFIYTYSYFNLSPIPSVKKVYLDNDDNVNIIFKRSNNKTYCYYSENDKIPAYNDKKWFLVDGNNCSFKIQDKSYYAYLKNEKNMIIKVKGVSNLGRIDNLKLDRKKIYLPINGTYQLKISYQKVGKVDETITWSSEDDTIASVNDGLIKGLKKGTLNITASIMNKKTSVKIIVTDLIAKRPSDGFDFKKPLLSCNRFSQLENDTIDELLKNNIYAVGYKTRAGVVEAARFLTLDFPYRINYFYENGRQTTNNVDGEGRYYHVGMYLHESRFSSITGSQKGPAIWGCMMYDRPVSKYVSNGLDCSGFVSWALLNGGFDVKDVGAGWSNNLDLTDYGDVEKIDNDLIKSNRIKVGDLLHSTDAGGHIGIIVGMDSSNYYVAQALWYNEVGVQITKISKEKLYKTFPHVVLMDKFYQKDGNLTNMW